MNLISKILYLKPEKDFKHSVWVKKSIRELVKLSEGIDDQFVVDGFI